MNKILLAWASGKTHGEIVKEFGLTPEQEFAVTNCSGKLSGLQIRTRLQRVQEGMCAEEIRQVMNVETEVEK